jgi:ABC-type multidrug transport system permease subunit
MAVIDMLNPFARAAYDNAREATRMSWSQRISMSVCVLFGFLYFGWIAWVEGWSFWLVAGLMALVSVTGFAIHRLMEASRSD